MTDPFGGSYFLERLTRDLEVGARETFEKIDALGGMVPAIEQGYPQREIANSAYRFQQALDRGTKTCVGVNRHVTDAEAPIETLYIDEAAAERQVSGVRALRQERAAEPVTAGARRVAPRRRRHGQPDAAAARRGARRRHPRRDVRRAARRLGRVRGERRLVVSVPQNGAASRGRLRLPPGLGWAPGVAAGGEWRASRSRSEGRTMRKIRVVIAKPGLDGHDRGAKVIARSLRDAGMEVIYTGLRQTPEQIVGAALQEDADAIGVSILSGAHNHICPRIMELLAERGLDDVLVVVGGIIPDADIPRLREIGIEGVFQPGTPMQTIVDYISEHVRPGRGETAPAE